MNAWLNGVNTTNFRIVVTVCVFAVTVLSVLAMMILRVNLQPYQWLITTLLAAEGAFAGIDVAQFFAKRSTDTGYAAAKAPRVQVEKANVVTTKEK